MLKYKGRSYFSLLFILLAVLATGCIDATPNKVNSQYFNIQSQISEDINKMLELGTRIEKLAKIDEKYDSISYQPDSLQWETELELFKKASINLPQYQDIYEVQELPDSSSNLKWVYFKDTTNISKVPEMSLYYLPNSDKIVEVVIEYREESVGFLTERTLKLSYDQYKSERVLKNWEIDGVQKIPGMDEVSFHIKSKVIFN